MSDNVKKNKSEVKKNILYALWIVLLVAAMTASVIVVAKISKDRNSQIDNPQNSQTIADEASGDGSSDEKDDSSGKGGTEQGDDKPSGGETEPVDTKIVFAMPMKNAEVIKKYTHDTVVFNSTLGAYMGHLAIDYKATDNDDVYCVYDGVVESVQTSYLTGTTITINHGNGLKTVYNSVEADEKLYEGKKVEKGEVLGKISANNLQEYKDGAHLHFEVIKNNEKIDPEEYLIGEEK